ncbi:MAG: tetratricopeptide repeat protein [Bacteroidia bacterium]|nr:MAG: tetratricopeptide repeat protein [Bacteroidia bacterium]
MIWQRKILLILFFPVYSICAGQNPIVDSLKMVLEVAGEDTTRVNTMIAICQNSYRISPDSSILYGYNALALSEKIDYQKGMANANKYIGMGYYFLGNYWETVNFWQQALQNFEAIGDKVGVSNILNNIGAVYNNEGDDTKALEFYLRSLKAAEEISDTLRIVVASINIGTIYLKKESTHDKAQEFYLAALPLIERIENYVAEGTVSVNLGEIYYAREEYDTALYYYEKSLAAFNKSNSGNIPYTLTNIGKVYMKRGDFPKAIEYQKQGYEIARQSDAKLEMTATLLGLAETYSTQGNFKSSVSTYKDALEIAEEIGAKNELRVAYEGLASSYAKMSDYANAFKYQTLLTVIKDTLYVAANDRKIQSLQFNFELEKRESQINLLTIDKELQEAVIQKQKFAKNTFIIGFVFAILVALAAYRNYRRKVRTNELLDRQKDEIENLVLNILPSAVASELRTEGYATPRHYESVSVLFTDFKGFTKIAEGLTPDELVKELNIFFSAFDDITVKHHLEKIKTIGDAYMCAGGIPTKNSLHPLDAVNAGLEMQEFMNTTNEKRKENGLPVWDLRIGIHTGPVVAGVVGKKKFAYDIWGNTVNIASRMESSGEAGKLNISSATFELVKKQFDCHFRGKVYAKNVGDIDMYFVEGKSSSQATNLNSDSIIIV